MFNRWAGSHFVFSILVVVELQRGKTPRGIGMLGCYGDPLHFCGPPRLWDLTRFCSGFPLTAARGSETQRFSGIWVRLWVPVRTDDSRPNISASKEKYVAGSHQGNQGVQNSQRRPKLREIAQQQLVKLTWVHTSSFGDALWVSFSLLRNIHTWELLVIPAVGHPAAPFQGEREGFHLVSNLSPGARIKSPTLGFSSFSNL